MVRDTAADPRQAAAAVGELARLGVAALAGEYHSVVAREAAARADALGLPYLCSSAVLDALTVQPGRGHDRRSGRAAGVRRMGAVAGRRRRRDPVPALPARTSQPTRCARRDGSARAAGRGAVVRRLRGLRHGGRSRRCAAYCRYGPAAHCRVLAACRGRRHPGTDRLLAGARHRRPAMGMAADPGRRPGSGRARAFPDPPHRRRPAVSAPGVRHPGRAWRCGAGSGGPHGRGCRMTACTTPAARGS
ncbi:MULTISPECIES: hypothetical protein [unclassified Nonomuraea]|uniref:hypothetical protein n=1 Tax=Nonomuraea sp. KC401 TaxID=1848324 RepID=UPI00207B9C58|nr:hypothetical protein [Nonomuraea sp. KC401]